MSNLQLEKLSDQRLRAGNSDLNPSPTMRLEFQTALLPMPLEFQYRKPPSSLEFQDVASGRVWTLSGITQYIAALIMYGQISMAVDDRITWVPLCL